MKTKHVIQFYILILGVGANIGCNNYKAAARKHRGVFAGCAEIAFEVFINGKRSQEIRCAVL